MLLTYLFYLLVLAILYWAIGYWFGGNPVAALAQKLIIFLAVIAVIVAAYQILVGGVSTGLPGLR
jgi:hypothetical protein